jgi:hypothetical protein
MLQEISSGCCQRRREFLNEWYTRIIS